MMERNYSDKSIVTAQDPNNIINKYNIFTMNGFKFHTKMHKKFIS